MVPLQKINRVSHPRQYEALLRKVAQSPRFAGDFLPKIAA